MTDELAPYQRLVFVTTSSCQRARPAALGEGRMAGTKQSRHQAYDELQESMWELVFVLPLADCRKLPR